MKQFVLTTISESGDHYIYFIEHPKKPTEAEVLKFLMEHGSDKDDDMTYENQEHLVEVKNFQKIPK